MTAHVRQVQFTLRDHQRRVHEDPTRFKAVVMHRRAGKSVFGVAKLVSAASQDASASAQYHYVGPSIRQTKAIAWKYAQAMAGCIPGCRFNQADLRVDFPHGPTLELLGVENVDSLRGRYSDGLVVDEAQLMPVSHWAYVMRPLLADREGWAIISGTPAGRRNLLGWAFEQENFAHFLMKADETGALSDGELADMRQSMSAEAWAQEMECDFDAALQGTYFAGAMVEMARSGRIAPLAYDRQHPVQAALDLGHSDLMPVLFFQEIQGWINILACRTYQFCSLPDMLETWHDLPFRVETVILPHDADVRDLTSGLKRREVFERRGYRTEIAPRLPIMERIEMSRAALAVTRIDPSETGDLVEGLRGYRAEHDEVKGVHRLQPLHSWHSHYADAFGYLATGRRVTVGRSDRARKGRFYA